MDSTPSPSFKGVALAGLLAFSFAAISRAAPDKITFPSADGLLVTADVYIQNIDKNTPFIVLFHQAGWSRGEYNKPGGATAPRLNALGFNCMAIDQRSGGAVNGVTNETHQRAVAAGKGTDFPDAVPDMLAAIAYAKAQYANGAVIGFGSSYGSALIIKIAGDDPGLVDGVLSFSPGEYFEPGDWIATAAANINAPVFITSKKSEGPNWSAIFAAIPAAGKVSFLPSTEGQHGSRALWAEFSDSEDYWAAVVPFLQQWVPSIGLFRARYGLAEDGSDDLVSAAGDGVANLVKYALGLSPSDALNGAAVPVVVRAGGGGSFQFERLQDRRDISYIVETSGGLRAAGWAVHWDSKDHPYTGGSAASVTESVELPGAEGELFVRLRVVLAVGDGGS